MLSDYFSNLNSGQWAIIGLCAFLVAWYFFASIYNRQRGLAAYKWLRRGITYAGEITEAQWLGSSGTGARLFISQANKPFRQMEAIYTLETREILPYWLVTRWRGRQDEFTFRANLRKPPKVEYKASLSKTALVDGNGYEVVIKLPQHWMTNQGDRDNALEVSLEEFLNEYGKAIRRVGIQKTMPHLTVQADLSLMANNAEGFFVKLENLLQEQNKQAG